MCSKVLKMPRKKGKTVKKVLEYEELNKDVEESEPPKARETSKKVRATRIPRKVAPEPPEEPPQEPEASHKEVVPPTPVKVKRLAHYVFTFKQEQKLIQFYEDNPMLWDRNYNEYRKMKQSDRDEIYKKQAVQYADCSGKL